MSLFNSVKLAIGAYVGFLKKENLEIKKGGIIRFALLIMFVVFALTRPSFAYTVVIPSTSAPAGLEKLFLANATNYMNSNLVPNPFAANTYSLTLYGLNPNYIPPTIVSLDTTTWVNTILAVSSDTFVNGYARGTTDQVYREIGVANGFWNLCQSTSTWFVPGSTSTFDVNVSSTTCQEVLNTVSFSMYQLLYGTFTPTGF